VCFSIDAPLFPLLFLNAKFSLFPISFDHLSYSTPLFDLIIFSSNPVQLDLSHNLLTGSLKPVSGAKRLRHLWLSHNKLGGGRGRSSSGVSGGDFGGGGGRGGGQAAVGNNDNNTGDDDANNNGLGTCLPLPRLETLRLRGNFFTGFGLSELVEDKAALARAAKKKAKAAAQAAAEAEAAATGKRVRETRGGEGGGGGGGGGEEDEAEEADGVVLVKLPRLKELDVRDNLLEDEQVPPHLVRLAQVWIFSFKEKLGDCFLFL
jgi:hypothetical protein